MSELAREGVNLAIYGMGTVFVFLTLLVLLTMLMSRAIARIESSGIASATVPVDSRTLAAITAAVRQYRNDHTE